MISRDLIPVGSKASCSSHKGTLIAYFTAVAHSEFLGEGSDTTELYAVLDLGHEGGYWTEGHETFIRYLVVHSNNLDPM